MARYQVPQFIDIEDKIIGPLTIRQFLIFLSAAGVGFILWTLLEFNYFIVGMIVVMSFAIMFSFVKINGRSFGSFVINLQKFILSPQKYTWQKEKEKEDKAPIVKKPETKKTQTPKDISEDKLKKLASELDAMENNNH